MTDSDLVCNACQLTITSTEQRSQHYKSEWHRYNVKRRCAGLQSISEQLFASQLAALNKQQQEQTRQSASQKCTICNKTFSSESSYEAHLTTKTHLKRANKGEEENSMPVVAGNKLSKHQQKKQQRLHQPVLATSLAPQIQRPTENITATPVTSTPITSTPATESITPTPLPTETKHDDDDTEDMSDIDGIETPAIETGHCLFCNRSINDFEQLLDHMLKQHGFFIPFVEYCTDLPSFIEYLCVKVGVGRVCLYCNGRGRARYPSVRAVQQHMMAKHHCKLRFEDDEEYEEYEEFFTFPNDDEEEESEELPTSSRARLDMLRNNSETSSTNTGKRHLTGMNDAGELVLSDGSTIGHRSLVNVYRQNFRPTKQVQESVRVNQLMAQYRALEMPGYLVNKARSDNVPIKVQRRINRVREKTNLAANFQHHFRPQVDF